MSDDTVAPAGKQAGTAIKWDDSNLTVSYANVVTTTATREEVSLLFGTHKNWAGTPSKELHVGLSDRIILSPFAAKRLLQVLGKTLEDYEARYGTIDVDMPQNA